MAKISLPTVASGYNLQVVNSNFDAIETEFQSKVLYRNNPAGEANQMEGNLDMNSNRILNLPLPIGLSEPARLQDVVDSIAGNTNANLIVFSPSGSGAVLATVGGKLLEFKSVKDFGAVGDGVTDDTTSISSALAAHLNVYFPTGTYRVTSSLTIRSGATLIGYGRLNTIISSEVIGNSLFKNTGSYTGFIYMSDMQLIGNGLTGASGNGHAINLIDPAIGSGAFTPAQSMFERLYIRNFKGLDVRDNSATAINAAAIISVEGLGDVFRDVSIENCGYGFFMHMTQNCRVIECLVTGCSDWGLFSYDNENLTVIGGDINQSGTDGVTNVTGYIETGLYTGNICSARDDDFILSGVKQKNSPGVAQTHLFTTIASIQGGWIRASHEIDKDFIGILTTNPIDVSIKDVTFTPTSGSAYSATRKIYHTRLTVASTHNIGKYRVVDNKFRTQASAPVGACVHLKGATSVTRMEGYEVRGNAFGTPQNVVSAVTIDADVLFDTGTFANGVIEGNSHYDATNVTKTAHYAITGGTFNRNLFISNSYSSQVTGAIAGIFSGFNPWQESITGAKTFALVDGNKTYLHPSSDTTARVWQIPANSTAPYAIGTKFNIINQNGAGVVSVAVVTDTLRLAGAGTTGTRAIAANGVAIVEKVASTEWVISGTGVT